MGVPEEPHEEPREEPRQETSPAEAPDDGPSVAEFARRVLDVVERIPPGRVLAYGDISELLGVGGPRQVARVLSRGTPELPWHRVLRADGTPAPAIARQQIARLRAEGAPILPDRDRVNMATGRWVPSPADLVAIEHDESSITTRRDR